jgi:hypothetical protein
MARLMFLLCLSGLVGACELDNEDRRPLPLPRLTTPPDPPGVPAPPPAPVPQISLGQDVQGRFVGSRLSYDLTVPSSGTLVARLTWDPFLTDSFLTLTIGSTEFRPAEPTWSPIVGRILVTTGDTYRLTIGRGGTGHDYDVPFVLTTSLER